MRLINTETGEFQSVDDPRRVRYAILSHVWAKPGDHNYLSEQTYHDLLRFQDEARTDGTLPISKFSDKLRRFCDAASRAGFRLGWADTCCIDKASSSELSEAINSMYRWYAYAGVCYAFLHDVKPRRVGSDQSRWRSDFVKSKWFKRGWTLQELIASRVVIFVCQAPGRSGGWQVLGSKHNLAAAISSATNIDVAVLTFEKPLQKIPVAQRMAWAQSRETSRLEDEAYCLMGIFGVNMQANYGEGRYAFVRLQEAILSQSPDQTIFAWGHFLDAPLLTLLPSSSGSPTIPETGTPPNLSHNPVAPTSFGSKQYLLASTPKDFDPSRSAKIVPLSRETFQQRLGVHVLEDIYQVFEITPYGHRTHFPLLDVQAPNPDLPNTPTHCAILACEDPDKGLLALLLRRRNNLQVTGNEFSAGAVVGPKLPRRLMQDDATVWGDYYRLTYITAEQLSSLRRTAAAAYPPRQPPTLPRVSVVYISRCLSWSSNDLDPPSIPTGLYGTLEDFDVEFSSWSRMVLEGDGYRVSGDPSISHDSPMVKFADSQSILSRTPSSRRANHVTISNNSGVYLSIQVGRCSCDLGRREGILGVLVSARDADALDGRFSSDIDVEHLIDHPLHVRSWSLDHGSLSRQIDFDAPNDLGLGRFTLRLTLTTAPAFDSGSARSPGTTSVFRVYRLSAELRERDRSEYHSEQLPPGDTIPSRMMRRGRSNSAPSLHIAHWLPRREAPTLSLEI
ncbi:hypothetical protein GSI_05274 [Ganoderma sinense ZZ0214-1]|uniref:Uncharacterized protein n=1 Tax=Ganoderma sinense ZZ0214-1 TaxID=1077348 RepID=A0A2G8SFP9_9APHY|nr:hypothetical protein GSI_05274 [Ganoderma sinense ZZ0214-1]